MTSVLFTLGRCAAGELSRLRACDYRSPDPAHLFPRVASGALVPGSLDTGAWRALEALVRRLTAGEQGALHELPAVWARQPCARYYRWRQRGAISRRHRAPGPLCRL